MIKFNVLIDDLLEEMPVTTPAAAPAAPTGTPDELSEIDMVTILVKLYGNPEISLILADNKLSSKEKLNKINTLQRQTISSDSSLEEVEPFINQIKISWKKGSGVKRAKQTTQSSKGGYKSTSNFDIYNVAKGIFSPTHSSSTGVFN